LLAARIPDAFFRFYANCVWLHSQQLTRNEYEDADYFESKQTELDDPVAMEWWFVVKITPDENAKDQEVSDNAEPEAAHFIGRKEQPSFGHRQVRGDATIDCSTHDFALRTISGPRCGIWPRAVCTNFTKRWARVKMRSA
jgi:hypothetical protein